MKRFAQWIALMALVFGSHAGSALADESTFVEVTFSVQDAGTFGVTMSAININDPLSFGTVGVDADQDQSVSQSFLLTYTDTLITRGAGEVSISFESFEPVTPVPAFPGSEFAHFQIPNRYLVLDTVGDVVVAPYGPNCVAGPISATTDFVGENFDNGVSRQVAQVESGCGVGTANQEIVLTLVVPAGVYPTSYSASVTIETTVQ